MIEQIPNNQEDSNYIESLDFTFTLSNFEQTICRNFQKIQQMLSFHHESINQLKGKIINNSTSQKLQNKQSNQNLIKKGTINEKINIEDEQTFTEKQVLLKLKQIQTPETQAPQLIKQQYDEKTMIREQNQTHHPSEDNTIHTKNLPKQQTNKDTASIRIIQLETGMIQSKIFELFERVRGLQQKQILGSRQNNKHFRQLQFQIQDANKAIEKNVNLQKEFNEEVQKLRNELSEYKLKKQSKINKVLHQSSLTQNNNTNSQTMDYMTEKIQFLLKNFKQMVPKKIFEDEKTLLLNSIDSLRRKLNETINETFFNQSIKNTQVKIYQTMTKYIKAHQILNNIENAEQKKTPADNNNQLDQIIEEGNKQFNERVNGHQQKIKTLTEQFQEISLELDLERKERVNIQQQWNQQFKILQEIQEKQNQKNIQTEKIIQSLKQNFSQKYIDSEAQIIQLQQSVEKINSQLKTFNYVRNQLTTTFSSIRNMAEKSESSIVDANRTQPELLRMQQKISINPEIEQDIAIQKKKVNKIYNKLQSYKQDLLSVREDFTRELQNLKMNVQKKADWESLKKALNYFDQKMKETKLIMQQVYEFSNKTQGGDSLAVKKGWTCLMCDRDIKNYEGKLSEVKFTNIFPNRDASPRIGGYYKQQQTSQQYKQVFMNNPGYNRAKRIGSLRSNQSNPSKQQLQS